MSAPASKRCVVAYATRERQYLWTVELAAQATVADALTTARSLASVAAVVNPDSVPWESAAVGIFGELCERADVPRDGDRIELYRPLSDDPRQRRREHVRRQRKSAR